MLNLNTLEKLWQTLMPDTQLIRAWEMDGGVSAIVIALEFRQANGTLEKRILRQDSDMPSALEFRLLQQLQRLGIPVPNVYHLDESAQFFPKPFYLMEFIEGKADFLPANLPKRIEQVSKTLVSIHRLSLTEHDFSFLPNYHARVLWRLGQASKSPEERRINEILQAVQAKFSKNAPVLLHGDYWAGNLLWQDGELLAVIDWEDAAIGDPLADVSNARLEILWAHGQAAMQAFTEAYQGQMPQIEFSALPYWDLYAALRPMNQMTTWGLDAKKLAQMQADLASFWAKALQEIAARGLG